MKLRALIPPFFLDCVVAIGVAVSSGGTQWAGSGFLYGDFIKKDERGVVYRTYLITNRHVLAKQKEVRLRFNPHAAKPAQEFSFSLQKKDGSPAWAGHPDRSIDVAVVQINPNFLAAKGINFSFFTDDTLADINKAKELGITEGDGVFALGFPLGLVGGERNYVIVRQGAIARIRDVLARSTKEFLVDVPVFPGNSGGPVILRPDLTAIEGTKSQRSALLLGIVKGYVPYQEIATSNQTQRPRVIFEENSGLAAVIPVDFIKEAIGHYIKTIQTSPKQNIPDAK